ncbi:MAG: 5'-3' exonuclease H3TH domain-containing protein [Patescibacteria group bacterium]|jgi:DNA polymerase-1
MATFIIVDANAVLHRAWHALPKLTDPKGRIVNAVYGFTALLLKLIHEQNPSYLAVTFDTKAPTFRHLQYKEYKAGRTPQPQEFYDQIPITKEVIKALNIQFYAKDGFESDDLIGALDNLKSRQPDLKVLIVTGDRDMFQLIDDTTSVYYFLKGGLSQFQIYDKESVFQHFGIMPDKLIDLKALAGDPSDNIPGVKNVGPKTALKLIKTFDSTENLYRHLKNCLQNKEECKIKKNLAELLIKSEEEVILNKKLLAILKNIEGVDDLEICRFENINFEETEDILKKLGFVSLIKRLNSKPEKKNNDQQNKLF